jgi:hypothetical protein
MLLPLINPLTSESDAGSFQRPVRYHHCDDEHEGESEGRYESVAESLLLSGSIEI